MVRRRAFGEVGAMKNKYRKYTKNYMKYLKFIHKEIGYLPDQPFRKLLKCGFYGFWNYDDWDYTTTKREQRLLDHYYDHILGVKD